MMTALYTSNQVIVRVCSNNCVKVKLIKLNNFDYGKATIEKERKENAFGRDYS